MFKVMTDLWEDVRSRHEHWLADGPDFEDEIDLIMTLEKDKAALLAVVREVQDTHTRINSAWCKMCKALAALPKHLK